MNTNLEKAVLIAPALRTLLCANHKVNLKYTEEDTEIVEHDIELINQLFLFGADNVSVWPLLMELKSADILKNALAFMVTYESEDNLEIGGKD